MALLSSYTQRNLLPVEALRVEVLRGHDDQTNPTSEPITRRVSKSYAYIGMDEKTARECMYAKLAQYTRRVEIPRIPGGYKPTSPLECLAKISMSPAAGDNYQVDIAVNYEDSFDPAHGDLANGETIAAHLDKLSQAVVLDEPLNRVRGIKIDTAEYVAHLDLETDIMYDQVFFTGYAQTVYDEGSGESWARSIEVTDDPFFGGWITLDQNGGISPDGRQIYRRELSAGESGTYTRKPGQVLYIRAALVNGGGGKFVSNIVAMEFFPFHFVDQGDE